MRALIFPAPLLSAFLAETDHVRTTIADDGAGIPQRDLVHLREFAPGWTSKVTGTGFGLPIAKRYIEAQHGTLNMESEQGCREDGDRPDATRREGIEMAHLLVVDDDLEIIKDVQARLKSMGHTCDSAGSQQAAEELLAKKHL